MKKIITLSALFFIFSKVYSQYYEASYFSYMSGISSLSYVNLMSFNNDKNGNLYSIVGHYDCTFCTYQISLNGINLPTTATPSLKMESGYAFGTFSSPVTLYGTLLNTNSTQKALIKLGSWALITKGSQISVNDSGYCFVLSDSIRLYSPAGQLVWIRPGGGASQISANNNLSYFVNGSTGIKRYKSNGNIDWQTSINGSFRITPGNRCVVKTGTLVYTFDGSDGTLISTYAGYPGGGLFDNDGNVYSSSGSTLSKYDSTGLVWQTQLTGTSFAHLGIDRNNNLYFSNNYTSHVKNQYGEWTTTPIPIVVPPTLFISPAPLNLSNGEYGYTAIYVGKINTHDFIPKITTGDIKAICKESTTNIPFTINKYHVAFTGNYKAELSDSTGNFDNPLVIGTANRSPIVANISFFNISGNKYKVRVVSNQPGVISKPSPKIQYVSYPPEGKIVLSNQIDNSYSCPPVILSTDPNKAYYKYNWQKKFYGVNGYSYYSSNDSITITQSGGDSYSVTITDTNTNCYTSDVKMNFYTTYNSNIRPDFTIQDTVCLNSGPVDLISNATNGVFSGNYIFDNKFYPDSAGHGLHAISLQINNAPACFASADTTKYIFVSNCSRAIQTLNISPLKSGYCIGDTIEVNFSYDSLLIGTVNQFKVQVGRVTYGSFYNYDDIGSGTSSPITCIIPNSLYLDESDYRIRVIGTDPFAKGTLNHDGNLPIGNPFYISNLLVDNTSSSCGMENSVIKLMGYGGINPVYTWHVNNLSFIDSIHPGSAMVTTIPGKYSVEITNEYGCRTFSDTVNIYGPAQVTPAGPISFCNGSSILLYANTGSGLTYQWNKSGVPIAGAVSAIYNADETGDYSCIVGSTCTSEESDAVSVIVKSRPPAVVTANGPLTFCAGDSVVLSVNTGTGYTYKWKKGINYIPGATSSDYSAYIAGVYRAEVTKSNGCSGTSAAWTVTVPCKTGESKMEYEKEIDVSVYPNPSPGDFLIRVEHADVKEISIALSDAAGKLISPQINRVNNSEFLVSGLSNGVYTAKITCGKFEKIIKMVKINGW